MWTDRQIDGRTKGNEGGKRPSSRLKKRAQVMHMQYYKVLYGMEFAKFRVTSNEKFKNRNSRINQGWGACPLYGI